MLNVNLAGIRVFGFAAVLAFILIKRRKEKRILGCQFDKEHSTYYPFLFYSETLKIKLWTNDKILFSSARQIY